MAWPGAAAEDADEDAVLGVHAVDDAVELEYGAPEVPGPVRTSGLKPSQLPEATGTKKASRCIRFDTGMIGTRCYKVLNNNFGLSLVATHAQCMCMCNY